MSVIQQSDRPNIIVASLLWNVVIIVACVALAITIFNLSEFGNLGRPVQTFAGFVALVPAVIAGVGSIDLFQGKIRGRFLLLGLYFVSMVLAIAILFHLWDVYFSFELFVDTLMNNATLALGFPLAYVIYWIAGRFDDEGSAQENLTKVALTIGGLTLIALILSSNVLETINYILSTYANIGTWATTIAILVFGFFGMAVAPSR